MDTIIFFIRLKIERFVTVTLPQALGVLILFTVETKEHSFKVFTKCYREDDDHSESDTSPSLWASIPLVIILYLAQILS